ncbi:hypothetical protein [Bacteroides fragilis]|nr:hypothetical protein [Bacteroides fragilis]
MKNGYENIYEPTKIQSNEEAGESPLHGACPRSGDMPDGFMRLGRRIRRR